LTTRLEILIVDDASTDDTPAVLHNLRSSDNRIRSWRTDRNMGPGAARNLAFEHAQGAYVAIQDDDDIPLPHRLERQVNLLEGDPSLGLVFSSVTWIDNNKKVLLDGFPGIVYRNEFPRDCHDVFRLLYLESNKIPNTTILFRRELTSKWTYPKSPWIGEDWFWCMQMAASGVRMLATAEPLVLVRRDPEIHSLVHIKNMARAHMAQHEVLRMMRDWLSAEGIHDFDRDHRLALANQLAREAIGLSGFRGLHRSISSLCLAPRGRHGREAFVRICRQAVGKVGRFASRSSE
jgi:glycosyltransferase involved in cell wall biosynthesis